MDVGIRGFGPSQKHTAEPPRFALRLVVSRLRLQSAHPSSSQNRLDVLDPPVAEPIMIQVGRKPVTAAAYPWLWVDGAISKGGSELAGLPMSDRGTWLVVLPRTRGLYITSLALLGCLHACVLRV